MTSIPHPPRALLALLVACALVLSACGGKEAAGAKDSSTGTESGKTGGAENADPHAGHDHGPGGHPDPNASITTNTQGPVENRGDQNPAGQSPTPQPMPQPIQELPELQFEPPLPTTPIAHVNGKPVPAADLLKYVLSQNFLAGSQALVLAKIVDRELVKENIEITDDDINAEIKLLLEKQSPGQSIAELEKAGKISMKHLRRQARTQRGWKEIFWRRQNVPEDQRHTQTNQMLMQFWMRQTMQGYETRIRGNNPGPIPGTVAQIIDKTDGNEMHVYAGEALDFLVGLAKLGGLLEGRAQIVDRAILNQELEKQGVAVTDLEIQRWAQEQHAKHPPPFTWPQICKIKGTSPEREMERMRLILAYKRVKKEELPEAEVMAFIEENKSFFLGKTKKVSHILVRTTDEQTDLPIEGAEETAARKIRTIHEKLVEGLDFGWMAETYSDDPITARGKGRLAQPIKQWGGPLDPAFRDAAWKLEKVGDMSEPVRSRFGWHVIKLEEVNEPPAREIDWKDPRYWDWVTDELLTQKANAWMSSLRDAADVKLEPNDKIFNLKEASYWVEQKPEPKKPEPRKDPPQKPDDGD